VQLTIADGLAQSINVVKGEGFEAN